MARFAAQNQFLNGVLHDDHRHEIKLTGTYWVRPWLSTGIRYVVHLRDAAKRLFFDPVTGTYNFYRAPVGVDPGQRTSTTRPTTARCGCRTSRT